MHLLDVGCQQKQISSNNAEQLSLLIMKYRTHKKYKPLKTLKFIHRTVKLNIYLTSCISCCIIFTKYPLLVKALILCNATRFFRNFIQTKTHFILLDNIRF